MCEFGAKRGPESGRAKRRFCRAAKYVAVGREARTMTRAIPRPFGVVPGHTTPHVRADGRTHQQPTTVVTIRGDVLSVAPHDERMTRSQATKRSRVWPNEQIAQ